MRIDRKKLVMAMMERDLNQKELAKKAGVSRVTVNGIKNGRGCCYETGVALAKALGMPLDDLLEEV